MEHGPTSVEAGSFGARGLPYHSPAFASRASESGEIASPGTEALKRAEPPALHGAGPRVPSTMLPFQTLLTRVQWTSQMSSPLSWWDFTAKPPDFQALLVLPILTPSRLPLAHQPPTSDTRKNKLTPCPSAPSSSRGLRVPLPLWVLNLPRRERGGV